MLNSLNILKQKKSLVLLIYFNRAQLFIWTKKSLELAGEFEKEPDDNFLSILQEHRNYPVIIITDFLEESFRHDTGVHAQGADRNALLERKLNYSFRNTPYRSATIIGRESSGRKDDKILLSALTKPEMLEPWVKMLLEEKFQIQTVTSVAYLMQAYSQSVGHNDQHLMIVSIEEGSELRQTFLSNGKVQFSRLTSLTTKESASLPNAINHESLQIRQYLERIKLLTFDSQMVIRVFSPLNIDKAALENYNNELNTFECFDINELATSYGLTIDLLDKSPTTLYLGRVLQRSQIANVYAPIHARKYFQLSKLAGGLNAASLVLVFIILFLKGFTFLDTVSNWSLVDNLQLQTVPLNRQYEQLTESFPETPIPSAEMALVVETAEKITNNSYLINDALSLIGRALTVAPELQITNIIWQLAEKEIDPNDPEAAAMMNMGIPGQLPVGQELQTATLQNRTLINVTIDGFAFSPQSYREAQNQVLFFQSALESFPGVTIRSSMLPTDVRVDTNVSTLVDNDALRSVFSIEFSMEQI